MATLTASERSFLTTEWRWAELTDAAVKSAYPGAREADRTSPFHTEVAALACLAPIHELLRHNQRLFIATIGEIVPLNFRFRPPRVRLFSDRYELDAGVPFNCERVDIVWGRRQTILYLLG